MSLDPQVLQVIGCGDAFGHGGRFQTCFALRQDQRAVLIDCGATSMTAMRQAGMDPLEVEAVVISHLHGDHFGGLPFLVLDAQFRRRTALLEICGPPGTGERLAATMEDLYPGSTAVQRRFELVVHELVPDGTPCSVAGATVRGFEVDHASGAPPLAVAVDRGGVRVAYSGDTAWTPVLLRAADGADLFLVEAYTWEREVPFHLSHRQVAEHLSEFGAGQVRLTHMSPEVLERSEQTCAPPLWDGATHLF